MRKYLAIYSDNINNVDILGLKLMSDKDMERYENLATSITWSFSYNLSEFDYADFVDGEDYLNKVEFKEISDEEFNTLNNLFGLKFGYFIDEEYLKIILSDDDLDIQTGDDDNYDDDNYLFSSDGDDY